MKSTLIGVLVMLLCVACVSPTVAVEANKEQSSAKVHTELAAQYYKVGQVAVAVDEAEQALQAAPDFVPAHNLLGLMYAQLHQNALADEHFAKALSLEPKNTDLRNNYAWYLCSSGRSGAAMVEFSKVLHDPLYASMDKALTNAGVCAARIGRVDMARSYLNAALDVNANNGVAYLYRAHIEVNQRAFSAAEEDYRAAQNHLNDEPPLLWLSARLAQAQGQRDESAAIVSDIVRKAPTSAEADWARTGQFDKF